MPPDRQVQVQDSIRARLASMNEQIERLQREGRDLEALNLAARADALARQMYREIAEVNGAH